ncbi:MAG: MFS transporter [Dehalococcoidales bacterium]|nr:MFS transporter [Dehalococcoidales bacterium]
MQTGREGGANWQRNLVALWIGQFLIMVAFSFFFPFIPLYVQTMGVNGTAEAAQWAGLITAASAVSMSIAQPIWGNLSDRWGRKPMVIRSMISGGIITAIMGFATSPLQLLLLRFIQGGLTGTVAASNALVATSAPKHRLGFALGLMQVAYFSGTSIGPLGGGLLADYLGYRAAFYVSGVLMLLGGVIVIFFVRERFTPPAADVPRLGLWKESRSLFALAIFPLLVAVIFFIQLGSVIVTPVLTLFISELSQGSNAATLSGFILALTGGVSAVSALAIGRMGDRIGHTIILPICMAGAALSYFPQAMATEVWQLLILRMLLGVFLGGLMPSANALVAGLVPKDHRGAAFGLTAMSSSLANAVGPLSAALVASTLGLRAVFFTTGLLYTLAWGWVTMGLARQNLLQRPAKRQQGGPA